MARGRPLGLLMAWLAAAECKASRDKHKHMVNPKHKEPGDELWFSHEKRVAGRQWLIDHGYADLLAKERPCRPGEGDEPEGVA